jgi:hypothetical protein
MIILNLYLWRILMKKSLMIGAVLISLSSMNSSYAVEPVSTAVAAGAAAKAAIATSATTIIGAGTATALTGGGAGIVAGFGTAKVMNDKVFSECQNQKACDAAKVGTYTGASVGTAGVIATVAMTGASTAGLATIGSIIGGGAVVGAATLIAAPIIAAAAIGGATYWWFARGEQQVTSVGSSLFEKAKGATNTVTETSKSIMDKATSTVKSATDTVTETSKSVIDKVTGNSDKVDDALAAEPK